MRSIAAVLAILVAQPVLAAPRLWGTLAPGEFGVGFRIVPTGRSELHIWYPAGAATDQKTLTVADYLQLSRDLHTAESSGPDGLRRLLADSVTGSPDGLSAETADELLATSTVAIRDAPAIDGRFPLVFWTHRYGTTAFQHVMSEYLASHGFIVAYAMADAPPVLPTELRTAADRTREFNGQLDRLTAALRLVRGLPNVDGSKVAILTWSYAGESAFELQQRERSVRAVVGVSSNVVDNGVYRAGARADGRQINVPYVLVDGNDRAMPGPLRNAAAPTYFIHLPTMAHGSFNVLEGLLPSIAGITTVPRWSKAGPERGARL